MANLNKVMLIGNLTRDPEIKYTPKGSAIAELGLAINRYYTTESGEKKEETTFVDVTLWGRQAEIAKEYLGKGQTRVHRRPAPARYLGRQANGPETVQAACDRRADAAPRQPW